MERRTTCALCGNYDSDYCDSCIIAADGSFTNWTDIKPETVRPGEIKDSGQRTEFSSGAVRDMSEGKGDMLSMPWIALLRLSMHYEHGAKKYGRFNYQKGIPVSSFIDSAFRHLAKYTSGEDDEDHLAAAAFNVLGAMQMEAEHPDMCDLPSRQGKRTFPYFPPPDNPSCGV